MKKSILLLLSVLPIASISLAAKAALVNEHLKHETKFSYIEYQGEYFKIEKATEKEVLNNLKLKEVRPQELFDYLDDNDYFQLMESGAPSRR